MFHDLPNCASDPPPRGERLMQIPANHLVTSMAFGIRITPPHTHTHTRGHGPWPHVKSSSGP